MHQIVIDKFDLQILAALQRRGNATNSALSEEVHLSSSQISRRVNRLEQSGIISGYAALLDPAAIGLGVSAFAQVILERHGETSSDAFERAVAALPDVVECFSVSGDADYVLRIVAPDLAAFSELMMKRILRLPGLAHIKTNIALKRVKHTNVLPLEHVSRASQPLQRVQYSDS
ncbi:Lrp/AsnC family transcriptional regulator [Aromatoleum diolicum]|uniref:Winged helix-turn-helix transcriptional regulator n=1 Tax=Aromatoleum diolicum TaxID=75796 RepID=A0ABX1QC85_9RHOO|nr:Lrp/AsnC family transcriptional regulator [Aromatoleum diolicum]NMG75583.1 winged helix-turn-helix transcriptional regulator [Aromatoleum diolicum]